MDIFGGGVHFSTYSSYWLRNLPPLSGLNFPIYGVWGLGHMASGALFHLPPLPHILGGPGALASSLETSSGGGAHPPPQQGRFPGGWVNGRRCLVATKSSEQHVLSPGACQTCQLPCTDTCHQAQELCSGGAALPRTMRRNGTGLGVKGGRGQTGRILSFHPTPTYVSFVWGPWSSLSGQPGSPQKH